MSSLPRADSVRSGLWDGVPYELQSPRWRAGLNKASGGKGWDPTLNESWATKFLNAQHNANKAAAARGGVNTSQLEGQTSFIGDLAGLGAALMQSIGVRNDAGTQPQVMPASWGRQSPGLDTNTLLMIGAVGLGVYLMAKS